MDLDNMTTDALSQARWLFMAVLNMIESSESSCSMAQPCFSFFFIHSCVFRVAYWSTLASLEPTRDLFHPLLWQAGVATSGITTAGFGQRMADRVMQEMLWWPEYARVMTNQYDPVCIKLSRCTKIYGHFVRMRYDLWERCNYSVCNAWPWIMIPAWVIIAFLLYSGLCHAERIRQGWLISRTSIRLDRT